MNIKAYKGFNKDMTCRGFQFKEGETYHEDNAHLCESGFHACENPLDCFGYYAPGTSVYHEVELDDVADGHDSDSKICGKTITVGARLDIAGICKASFDFIKSKTNGNKEKKCQGYGSAASVQGDRSAASVQGNWSAASVQGNWSAASVQGNWSAASVQGNWSAASVQGNWSAASVQGNWSAASVQGDRSAASVQGNRSAASVQGYGSAASVQGNWSAASVQGNWSAASVQGNGSAASVQGYWSAASVQGNGSAASVQGYWSAASVQGYGSAASVQGYWSAASVQGYGSVSVATGNASSASSTDGSVSIGWGAGCKCKGEMGSYILLIERGEWDGEKFPQIGEPKLGKIDGKSLKPDTWYTLKDGEFVESPDD